MRVVAPNALSVKKLFALIEPEVKQLEERFDLPTGFLENLQHEDDWSFVIKLHAVIESTLTWCIEDTLTPLGLGDLCQNIDLSGGRVNKLSVARSLSLVEDDHVRVVKMISKIRNRIAHNIRNVRFNFTDFIEKAPHSEKNEFSSSMALLFPEDFRSKENLKVIKTTILQKPKEVIFANAILVVGVIVLRSQTRKGVYECRTVPGKIVKRSAQT